MQSGGGLMEKYCDRAVTKGLQQVSDLNLVRQRTEPKLNPASLVEGALDSKLCRKVIQAAHF